MFKARDLDRLAECVEQLNKNLVTSHERSRQPASGAAALPAQLLSGSVISDGIAVIGNGGVKNWSRGNFRKSLQSKVEYKGGKKGSFGEWLYHLTEFSKGASLSEDKRKAALEVCKAYDTKQYSRALDHSFSPEAPIVTKALMDSDAVSGGYTVLPTEFSEQLFEIAIEESIVEPRAWTQPLTTRQMTIPALDQVNETYQAQAGQSNLLAGMNLTWIAEAATRQQSQPRFRNVVATAWEASFYMIVSNNLLNDNAVGLESYFPQLFTRVVSWGSDYAFLQGNGVGQPLGMLNCKAAIQVTRSGGAGTATLSYTDITNMQAKIYTPNRLNDLVWIIHPTVKPKLLQLNDNSGYSAGTGRLVFQPYNQGAQAKIDAPQGAQSYGKLLGNDVMVSEKVPAAGSTGDIGLYDCGLYGVFPLNDIEIAISTHVPFLQNATAFRVVVRKDGQPMIGNYITYADAGANSTASPFVLLR